MYEYVYVYYAFGDSFLHFAQKFILVISVFKVGLYQLTSESGYHS